MTEQPKPADQDPVEVQPTDNSLGEAVDLEQVEDIEDEQHEG